MMELDMIVCGDCLDIAPTIPDSSVNLIVSDWPYYKVKSLDWDRQWKTAEEYIEWIGLVCEHYCRILAPNGSLYAFASPKMAARIEVKVGGYFNMLNRIIWRKGKFDTKAEMFPKDILRSFFPIYEIVFLAEHCGADNAAKGESGYGAKCDELRGFVFEPLRAYLDGERKRAGLSVTEIKDAWQEKHQNRGGIAGHWFTPCQWRMVTPYTYSFLQGLFNHNGRGEYLRAEYEDLRAEYEDLRRPFSVTAQDQYTDVWEFPTVKYYSGKHPCEKPLAMLEHIIKVSSKEGDVVADFFCGSGVTAEAAANLGRRYFCCDIEEKWVNCTNKRIEKARLEMAQLSFSV